MMAGRRVHFVMPDELVERIDAALAEGQSRGEFVRRAVERALDESGDGPPATSDEAMSRKPSTGTVKPPAPAEQPVHEFVPPSTHEALVEAAKADGPVSRADAFRRASSQAKRDVRPIPKKG